MMRAAKAGEAEPLLEVGHECKAEIGVLGKCRSQLSVVKITDFLVNMSWILQ